MMAAGGAMGAVFMKGFIESVAKEDKTGKAEKIVKDLTAALNKHGLTDEVLKGFNLKALFDPKKGKDPAATKKILAEVAGKIKDRCAFLKDLFKALPSEGGSPLAPLATAQVKNIKVDGDTAKGVLITTKGGKEKEQPIEFRKVGGSWKVEMPMGGPSAPGAGGGAPPAPGRLVSVRSRCSLGAHDLDRISCPVELRLLTGAESFTPLGGDQPVPVTAGEFGYVDGAGRLRCRLDLLQAEFSKVTSATVNVLLMVEGTAAHDPGTIRGAFDLVIEGVTRHCGGAAEVVALPF
ncbi:MAG: hypothetical protein L0Z62_42060 [Gemmataceae bacterium]|nr:hypothetical protein [Gemmataceae bacterium]